MQQAPYLQICGAQ